MIYIDMGKKNTGGEDSYLNNFVNEVFDGYKNEINGGGNKHQNGGLIELSPFLVALITLGMRVASDPKFASLYKKHKIASHASIIKGGYDEILSMSSDKASVGGKKKRGRKTGGEGAAVSNPDVQPLALSDSPVCPKCPECPVVDTTEQAPTAETTGGRKRPTKKGGDYGSKEMFTDVVPVAGGNQNVTDIFKNMLNNYAGNGNTGGNSDKAMDEMFTDMPLVSTGGKKGKKGKKGGYSDKAMDEMFTDMLPATGGKKGKKGGYSDKAMDEMFTDMLPVSTGGKKGKKGGNSDKAMDEMFTDMLPVSTGGKKGKGKRGGYDELSMAEMFADATDVSATSGGKRKRKTPAKKTQKKGGGEAEDLFPL